MLTTYADHPVGLLIPRGEWFGKRIVIVLGGRLPHRLVTRITSRMRFINRERRGHRRPVLRIVASTVEDDAAAMARHFPSMLL